MNQRNTNSERRRAEFGSYLKDLVKRRWKKQKNAAIDLGISETQLSQYVNGKRIAPDDLLTRLAEKCNVHLEEILRRKYWPQLLLLTGIVEPARLPRSLTEELEPQELEEVTRYVAFLLLKRHAEQVKNCSFKKG